MNFFNTWLQNMVISVIVATIIEMLMPNGKNKKYIKVVIGMYIIFNIIAPIIDKFTSSNFKISSIIKGYNQNIETFSMQKTEDKQDESIREVYISNLKNNIKNKIKEKGYDTEKILISLDNSENYNIEKITVYLSEIKETEENSSKINEIEKINIQISKKNEKGTTNNNITDKTKEEIKQYLAGEYEISKDIIEVN